MLIGDYRGCDALFTIRGIDVFGSAFAVRSRRTGLQGFNIIIFMLHTSYCDEFLNLNF